MPAVTQCPWAPQNRSLLPLLTALSSPQSPRSGPELWCPSGAPSPSQDRPRPPGHSPLGWSGTHRNRSWDTVYVLQAACPWGAPAL